MPTEEKHEIKMMYAVYADGRKKPIVIDEIKDLSLEEAEPILEEHNFVKVTRCKDCVHYQPSLFGEKKMCFRKDVDGVQICYDFSPDDYCSYGERREDEYH